MTYFNPFMYVVLLGVEYEVAFTLFSIKLFCDESLCEKGSLQVDHNNSFLFVSPQLRKVYELLDTVFC